MFGMHRVRRTQSKAEVICVSYTSESIGHDLLQQWNTQINIPAVSDTHLNPTHVNSTGYNNRTNSPPLELIK